MDTITTEFDFFQNNGADDTCAAAAKVWAGTPAGRGRRVIDAKFVAAYPGRPGEGRWVTIAVTHTMDLSFAHAD